MNTWNMRNASDEGPLANSLLEEMMLLYLYEDDRVRDVNFNEMKPNTRFELQADRCAKKKLLLI